jgi:hypothetical protein
MLVTVLSLASFGAMFAAARADRKDTPAAAPAAAPSADVIPAAASVQVSELGDAARLPAMQRREVRRPAPARAPAPEPVVEEPEPELEPEPVAPAPEPELRRLRLIR